MGIRNVLVCGAALGLLVIAATGLQGQPAPSADREERFTVKRYMEIPAEAVYEAAVQGVRAHVRFVDNVTGRTGVPEAFRRIRLYGESFVGAAALRTESGLVCVIPRRSERVLAKLAQLERGQCLAFEGTTLGRAGTIRALLVDQMFFAPEEKSEVGHELLVHWPGVPEERDKRIVEPGIFQIEFPCRHVTGKKEEVKFVIEEKRWETLIEELKRDKHKRDEPERHYKSYAPRAVYEHALRGNQIDVQFRDAFKREAPRSRNLRVARIRGRGELRIRYAFETYSGLACLIPTDKTIFIERARAALPGQDVLVKGTIIGRQGIYRCVLVDELGVAGRMKEPDVWAIEIHWPGEKTKLIYQPGRYRLELPCKHAQGQKEVLQLMLREVRLVPEEDKGKGS